MGVRESGEDGVVARVTWDNGRSTVRVSVISLSLIFFLVPEVPGGSDRGVGPGRPSPPQKMGRDKQGSGQFLMGGGDRPAPALPPPTSGEGEGREDKNGDEAASEPRGGRGWGPNCKFQLFLIVECL